MKYSKQKEIILEGLTKNKIHPTAEKLYSILKEENPNLSLATVYRNLNKLSVNNNIKKIDGLDVSSHFDHNTHPHFHMICDKCSKIYDIPYEISPNIEENVKKLTNHKVISYDITLRGICENCLEKETQL